jgi:hypothetical protein
VRPADGDHAGMHNASHIRRYVLLRQRDRDATASRWSMERIAATPRDASAPTAARPLRTPGERR